MEVVENTGFHNGSGGKHWFLQDDPKYCAMYNLCLGKVVAPTFFPACFLRD